MQKKVINISSFIPYGLENAISMSKLAIRTGESKRTVRKLIQQARLDGELICSTCNTDSATGYYFPLTPDEARPYYRQQRARINTGIAAISVVSKYVKEALHND